MKETDAFNAAPHRISFKVSKRCLHAYVEGLKASVKSSREYWSQILDEARRRACDRILIEETNSETLTASKVFEFAKGMADAAPPGIKLALVDRRPENRELNRFGVLVANNRGLDSRFFDSIADAEAWLIGDEQGK